MLKYYKINDIIKYNSETDVNIVSPIKLSKVVYEYVDMLKQKYEMKNVFVDYDDINKQPQIVFLKKCGTNGKENTIKNSLLEIYFLINQLEQENIIDWVQVLDIEIDNADDVYYFSITFTLK